MEVAGSKVLRRTSPQSGKSPQAEKRTFNSLPRVMRHANDADLCRSINLCLPGVLSLSQDSGSHQLIPVLIADEVRRLEEDGRAVSPRHGLPPGLGREGAIDSTRYSFLICLVICANVTGVIRRNQLLGHLARLDLRKTSHALQWLSINI